MNRVFILSILLCIKFLVFSDNIDDGITLFNNGVSSYQNGDFNSAYIELDESISLLDKEGSEADEWLLNAYLWIGATASNLGYSEIAEENYLKSLTIAKKYKSPEYEYNIITALANLKYELGNYSAAGDFYLKASTYGSEASLEFAGYCKLLAMEYTESLNIYNSLIDVSVDRPIKEIAGLYSFKGNCLYYLQDLDEALNSYNKSINLIQEFGDSVELSQYYAWVGKIYFDKSQNKPAIMNFNKSLKIANDLESKLDESRVLAYFGFLYSSIGKYIDGIDYYEKSLKVAKEIDKVDFIISAYESLSWIYDISGNNKKSIEVNRLLIDYYKETGNKIKLAEYYNNLGLLLYNKKSYIESIPLYKESIKLYREFKDYKNLSVVLFNLGMSYEHNGEMKLSEKYINESLTLEPNSINSYDYESQIDVLQKMIPQYQQVDNRTELMHLNNNIGVLYSNLSDYIKAIEFYSKAKDIAIQLKDYETLCIILLNMSQSKSDLSMFDEALEINNEALNIAKKYGLESLQAELWNSKGELYRAWGWWDKSLTCYYKSESLYKKIEDSEGLSAVYNNIAQALRISGDPLKAISFYNKALKNNEFTSDKKSKAIYLSNLGEANRELNNNEIARGFYEKALQIDISIKNLQGIHIRKNNISLLDLKLEEYDKAIVTFEEGREYWKKIGDRRQEAIALKNLWYSYFAIGEYNIAAEKLVEAVNIQEEIRLTAEGSVRREYLDSQISSYRNLAATYYYLEDPLNSLYYMELSRGKYLLEQMNVNKSSVYDWNTYKNFIEDMSETSNLLSYSITEDNLIQGISVNKERVSTTLIQIDQEFIDSIIGNYESLIDRYVKNEDDPLTQIFKFYRIILARPVQTRTTSEAIEIIGKYLERKLIKPFEHELDNKTQLIIVPDGILGTIPFEVLQESDGRYLIEKYDISYSQSLVISQSIKERVYSDDRNTLLAFGGANYETKNINEYDGDSNVDIIRQEVIEMIRTGSDTRKAYTGMGIGSWQNLPGTLKEVNLLAEIIPSSEIITGSDVTEELVFKKSDLGELANYKVIHFATHGIVVPEIPEMSAVVLSQNGEIEGNSDGYLTMSEIATLDIKADFVNLSACDTGLGKVYQGEGVVGLTQAFLIAGANALSVSLWQVSDDSTMKFMTGVYSLVENQGFSYSGAISEMKRVFLKDEIYKSPFYWAPFVLYGDSEAGL